nr:MAG TPA: hypothetical protein [Caudoviricetes sp.]
MVSHRIYLNREDIKRLFSGEGVTKIVMGHDDVHLELASKPTPNQIRVNVGDLKPVEKDQPDILYKCNGRECEKCAHMVCNHTTKIEYAKNFKKQGCVYVEGPNDDLEQIGDLINALMDNVDPELRKAINDAIIRSSKSSSGQD